MCEREKERALSLDPSIRQLMPLSARIDLSMSITFAALLNNQIRGQVSHISQTLHSDPRTLHSKTLTPYTLIPTRYTPHSTPCTHTPYAMEGPKAKRHSRGAMARTQPRWRLPNCVQSSSNNSNSVKHLQLDRMVEVHSTERSGLGVGERHGGGPRSFGDLRVAVGRSRPVALNSKPSARECSGNVSDIPACALARTQTRLRLPNLVQ